MFFFWRLLQSSICGGDLAYQIGWRLLGNGEQFTAMCIYGVRRRNCCCCFCCCIPAGPVNAVFVLVRLRLKLVRQLFANTRRILLVEQICLVAAFRAVRLPAIQPASPSSFLLSITQASITPTTVCFVFFFVLHNSTFDFNFAHFRSLKTFLVFFVYTLD